MAISINGILSYAALDKKRVNVKMEFVTTQLHTNLDTLINIKVK